MEPASTSITALGPFVNPDTPATINLGGLTFHGIITNCVELEDEGRLLQISVSDNRIRLKWDTVFCSFNNVEVIEDDPLTPGVDRKRKYKHVYPENWDDGVATYTNEPLTAQQILAKLRTAPTVDFGWAFGSHDNLKKPVFDLDAIQGKKLGNLIQEICERCNVQVTLEGANTLVFTVKGEGSTPSPPDGAASSRSRGLAIGGETKIRVVGDRNVYQVTPIELEADWNRHYEQYWFEPAWVARVKLLFNVADPYEAAARAREVTIREYCDKTSDTNSDFRLWQDVCRMELPVWIYIRQIVYKAYRIPLSFKIGSYGLDQLDIYDALICDVKWTTEGVVTIDSGKYYPDASAFVIARGMDIDFGDTLLAESITPGKIEAAATLWTPRNKFRVDQKNKGIVFESAMFVPGQGEQALVRQVNSIDDDEKNKYELEAMVVPNAQAVVYPAAVKCALSFSADRYAKWFGSGLRKGCEYVPGLARHVIMTSGSGGEEVPYAWSGKKADDVAQECAAALIARQAHIPSGGYRRHGGAGAALTGAVDRLTARLTFNDGGPGEGISEELDYSKERGRSHFEPERELERREKSKDLFPGQSELREDVRRIRLMSRLRPTSPMRTKCDSPTDFVMATADKFVSLDSDYSYPVGMPVCAKVSQYSDGALQVDSSGPFVGCLVASGTPAAKGTPLPIATKGIVPCRVKGPFKMNDSVGVNTGANYAELNGDRPVGQVQQSYSGSETVVVNVRIASEGGSPKLWNIDLGGIVPDPMTILADVLNAIIGVAFSGIGDAETIAEDLVEFFIAAILEEEEPELSDITEVLNSVLNFNTAIANAEFIANQIVDAFGIGIAENIASYFLAQGSAPKDGDYLYTEQFGIVYTIFRQQAGIPSPNAAFRVQFDVPTDFDDPESATTTFVAMTLFPAPDIPALAASLAYAILGILQTSLVSLISGILSAIIKSLIEIKPLIEELIEAAIAALMALIVALQAAVATLIAKVAAIEELLANAPEVPLVDIDGFAQNVKVLGAIQGADQRVEISFIRSSDGYGAKIKTLGWAGIAPIVEQVDWREINYLGQKGEKYKVKVITRILEGYPKEESAGGQVFEVETRTLCNPETGESEDKELLLKNPG